MCCAPKRGQCRAPSLPIKQRLTDTGHLMLFRRHDQPCLTLLQAPTDIVPGPGPIALHLEETQQHFQMSDGDPMVF